jgi:hypothetical protein
MILSVIASNWLNNTFYGRHWSRTKIVFVAWIVFILGKLFILTPVVGPSLTIIMVLMCIGAILLGVGRKSVDVQVQAPAGKAVTDDLFIF